MSTSAKNIAFPTDSVVVENSSVKKMTIPDKDRENVCKKIIQNMSREVPKHILMRDGPQNSIDAILQKEEPVGTIYITAGGENKNKLTIVDTGIGFTSDVIRDNFNSTFNSAKTNSEELLGHFDECKGIGIKITSYRWSELHYKSKSHEGNYEFKFGKDNDGYPGLIEEQVVDDGDLIYQSIRDIEEDDFDYLSCKFNSPTGTELTIYGQTNDEDTWHGMIDEINDLCGGNKKIKKSKQPGWAYVRYLNMRYYSIPDNVEMLVNVGKDQNGNDRVEVARGAHHYLKIHSINSGIKKYTNLESGARIPFNLEWYIIKEDGESPKSSYNNNYLYYPFFAIKHKNELYGSMRPHRTRTTILRNCGAGIAKGRLVLIVSFDEKEISVMNSRKNININGHDVDLGDIYTTISEDLPPEIEDLISDILSKQNPLDSITKGLREYLRNNFSNIHKKPELSVIDGSKSKTSNEGSPRSGNGSGGGNKTKTPRAGSGRKKQRAIARVRKNEIPIIIYTDDLNESEWATMDVNNWTLSINKEYSGITDMANLRTMADLKTMDARKNIVLQGLINKSVEYIFNMCALNPSAQNHDLQFIFNENLDKQAWLSKSNIENAKRSDSNKQ